MKKNIKSDVICQKKKLKIAFVNYNRGQIKYKYYKYRSKTYLKQKLEM